MVSEKDIMDALRKKTTSDKCPLCGKDYWEVFNQVGCINPISTQGNFGSGVVIQAVQISCGNCGYIMQFNIQTLLK